MALVTCPECGKENISDSAETCPSCGYGIKDHFEQIEQEKAFIEQKQENLQRELENELKKIDSMSRPYKPSLSGILSQHRNWAVLVFWFSCRTLVIACCAIPLYWRWWKCYLFFNWWTF